LSEIAHKKLIKLGIPAAQLYYEPIDREDPRLIKVVKKLGEKANGPLANLKIVKIPADIKYEIEECNGVEWLVDEHRFWK